MREYSAWEGCVYLLHKKKQIMEVTKNLSRLERILLSMRVFGEKRVETYIHLAIVDLKIHTNTHI